MSENRPGVTESSTTGQFSREHEVEEIVGRLIAIHGYYSAIEELLRALNDHATARLADPQNPIYEREFAAWVEAVKAAINKHIQESTFEQLVDEQDVIRARGMSIWLN